VHDLRARARAIADDRLRGAAAIVEDLLPVLDAALAEGQDATIDVARIVCRGQPAMAPIWNLCGAAIADFSVPGRYQQRRAEVARAPRALLRVAAVAVADAVDTTDRRHATTLLTVSYSSSVAAVLTAVAARHSIRVVCAESLPGGEGVALSGHLAATGVVAEVVPDAMVARHLDVAAGVVVGADAIAAHDWTNKVGTYGICAAAWFSGVPVFVVASRDKLACAALRARMSLPDVFEWVPAQLATVFLTDAGQLHPGDVAAAAERHASDVASLLAHL
jgi:translation initiation factor 2B subunit (eIF-2B alpha/beta/delta family)